MEFLKKLDLFGTAVNFRVFGDEKYHSAISIFCSLFIIIFTIIFTYFFGLDFIFHSESKAIQSTRTSKTYEFYNLTMDNLFFAWRIEGVYGEEINFTDILYPHIGYYSYKTGNEIQINYERCENFNLSFDIPKDINNYYCSDLSNYSVGGGWENENKINYFYFKIDICENILCPSKTDYLKFLNLYGGLYLIIYYPTISFLPEEEIPYQISYNKANIFLDAQLINVNRFYIQKYLFEDDNGWIFPNVKKYNLFGIAEIETYYFLNDIDEGDEISLNSYIYTGNFYIDKKYSYHKRWFTKAFESLAIISAFYKVVYIIFSFISSTFNRFILLQIIYKKFNNSYKSYNNHELKISHPSNEISNVRNNNDLNSKVYGSNTDLKLINANNLLKNMFNIKKTREIQPVSFSNKGIDASFVKQIKDEREINKKIPKLKIKNNPVVYKGINQQNVSDYILLCFHIFNCCLSEKKKVLYKMNNMNRNFLLKKIDIEIYLDLFKNVDYLLNIQNKKNKKNNNFVCSFNLLGNHI